MSSANRERRRQNREARTAAVEESLKRARRQRVMFAAVGLGLAVVVGIVLVARAQSKSGKAATSTTSTTVAASSTTTGSTTTSTTNPGAAGKPCVAVSSPIPAGTPPVPVPAGPPPKDLVKLDVKVGTGAEVKPGATVTVNYVGVACSTGKIFDSSFARHQPFTTPLAGVVPGWTQGIPGMKVGGERLLGIPPALAYKDQSPGAGIAPNETLWFVIDLLNTK